MYFKDEQGGLHFLGEADIASGGMALLPLGCVEVSDEEAAAILNPPLTLAQAQVQQIAIIEGDYQSAIQQPVAYMGATFQADENSQTVLTKSLSPCSVPAGFFWLDINNAQVPMTFQQLQGLAAAMLSQGQTAFAKKTALKQQVRAATSVAAVRAITWGEA